MPFSNNNTNNAYTVSVIIGRSRGRCQHASPQQDPILSFLHTFSLKSTHVGGQHPPMAWRPPNGKSWIRHWLSTDNI